jgi:hypothetical protein
VTTHPYAARALPSPTSLPEPSATHRYPQPTSRALPPLACPVSDFPVPSFPSRPFPTTRLAYPSSARATSLLTTQPGPTRDRPSHRPTSRAAPRHLHPARHAYPPRRVPAPPFADCPLRATSTASRHRRTSPRPANRRPFPTAHAAPHRPGLLPSPAQSDSPCPPHPATPQPRSTPDLPAPVRPRHADSAQPDLPTLPAPLRRFPPQPLPTSPPTPSHPRVCPGPLDDVPTHARSSRHVSSPTSPRLPPPALACAAQRLANPDPTSQPASGQIDPLRSRRPISSPTRAASRQSLPARPSPD